MKLSLKGLTGAAAMLAAALGLNLAGPHRAYAAPGLALPDEGGVGVTLLSPEPNTPLDGLKPIEVSAFYQGTSGNRIVAVELYLDGVRAAGKTLDVPEARGVVSFLIDVSQITPGTHRIVVRATAADQEVKSVRGSFRFGDADAGRLTSPQLTSPMLGGSRTPGFPPSIGSASGLAPTLHLINPTEDGKVQGVVTLRVEAQDPSGKAPYVSLFIDKTFKTLRNYAPYEFEWDTTNYANGFHTIEAYGYNDSPNVGQARSMRLYVNNPGGETFIRHDLLDGVKTAKAAFPHSAIRHHATHKSLVSTLPVVPKKALGRPLPLRRPDLLMAAEATKAEARTADAAPPRMAAVSSSHARATHPARRQMARVPRPALRFGPLDTVPDLSAPYAVEAAVPAAPITKYIIAPEVGLPRDLMMTPMRGFKPLPDAPTVRPRVALRIDPNTAMLAETPARHVFGKMARLQRLAGLRLPSSDLASPFLVAPHTAPALRMPTIKLGAYQAEMRYARATIKPVMRMHPLRVHLPASLGSLLRAAGQTTLRFNHTTVAMDRPLTAQDSVLFGPLRQIFEQGGGTLTWQARTGTVHAKSATRDITLTIGRSRAVVNAQAVALDGKPYLLMGRTMVPVSFISAAMDADVQFDAATGHLLIVSRK